jgi:hypothetical protein
MPWRKLLPSARKDMAGMAAAAADNNTTDNNTNGNANKTVDSDGSTTDNNTTSDNRKIFRPWNKTLPRMKGYAKKVRRKLKKTKRDTTSRDTDLVQLALDTMREEADHTRQPHLHDHLHRQPPPQRPQLPSQCFDEVFSETFVEDYNQILDEKLVEEAARLQLARAQLPPRKGCSLHGAGVHCLDFRAALCHPYTGPWDTSNLGGTIANPEIDVTLVAPPQSQAIGGAYSSNPSLYAAPHPLLKNSTPNHVQNYLDSIIRSDQHLRGMSLLVPNASSIKIPDREVTEARMRAAAKLRQSMALRELRAERAIKMNVDARHERIARMRTARLEKEKQMAKTASYRKDSRLRSGINGGR